MLILCKIPEDFDVAKHFDCIESKLEKDVWEGAHTAMKDNIIEIVSIIKDKDFYSCDELKFYEAGLFYRILQNLNLHVKTYESYNKYDFFNILTL